MSTFKIGDVVNLPRGEQAVLKWVGRIPNKTATEYAGVEVIGPDAHNVGKHSGAYQGQQFFETSQPGTGLFLTYTHLVSANVRSTKLQTPATPRTPFGAASPGPFSLPPPTPSANYSEIMSPSPRFHKLPNVPLTELNLGKGTENVRDSADAIALLKSQIEELNNARQTEQQQMEKNRQTYRDIVKGLECKIEDMKRHSNTKIENYKQEYEMKLSKARRASTMMNTNESGVEEQRLALANMQNQLIAERENKQSEIDKLQAELAEANKVVATVRDLEKVISELSGANEELIEAKDNGGDLDSFRAQNEDNERKISDLIEELESAKADADSVKTDLRDALAQITIYKEEASNARSEAHMAAKNLDKIKNELATAQAEIDMARADATRAKTSAGSNDSTVAELTSAKAILEEQNKDLNKNLDESQAQIEKYASEIESLNAALRESLDMRDSAVKAAVEAAKAEAQAEAQRQAASDVNAANLNNPEVPLPSISPSKRLDFVDDSELSINLNDTAGRDDWCSLCEREGHTAIDCPFE